MSNPFFNWVDSLRRFARFDTVRAEDANDAFDQVSAGFDNVQADVERALKLPDGTADQVISLTSGQRAGLVVGFDSLGNVTAMSASYAYRGDWQTSTVYRVNDLFRDSVSKNLYFVAIAHTSGVLATDIAAGKDVLAFDFGDVQTAVTAAQDAASAASGSAGAAADSASDAEGSAETAADEASLAMGYRNQAANSASAANTSAGNALTSETNAATTYVNFDKRSLGPKASNPSTDNQGGALATGALYFNTTAGEMRVYNGSAWLAAYLPAANYLAITGGTLTGALNEAKGADIASAATVNLDTTTGNLVHITGTTTITAVTLSSGADRLVIFDGILTLTHHATNNNLPGGVSLTTAAGDRALYRGDGSTVRCLAYFRADGSVTAVAGINELKGADIASAASMSGIWGSAKGNVMGVTGTTTTTGFGTAPQAGSKRTLLPAAAWPITASASVTIPGIPSASTYTCAAGDRVEVLALTTTTFLLNIFKAGGAAMVGAGLPTLHVREEQSNTTDSADSGITSSGTTRTLNTVKTNTIGGASLASNQVTLPAGTYEVRARAPLGGVAVAGNTAWGHRLTLFNVTDWTTILAGSSSRATNGATNVNNQTDTWVMGTFVLAATKVLSLVHYGNSSSNTPNGGLNNGISGASGIAEVYSEAVFTKVA